MNVGHMVQSRTTIEMMVVNKSRNLEIITTVQPEGEAQSDRENPSANRSEPAHVIVTSVL